MGVVEQCQPMRPERDREFGAARDVAHALLRQAVHQIDIEVFQFRPRAAGGGALDQLERLHAADGALHLRRDVLHAEAGAVDADGGERAHQRAVDPARVELDRVLLEGRQIEARGQFRGHGLQPFRAEDRGRAAAPVQMGELAPGQALQQLDFLEQPVGIGVDRLALAYGAGITAAVEAHLGAERHVDIERQAGIARQLAQPLAIEFRPDGGREMRRGRVGRVARDVAFGEREGGAHDASAMRETHCSPRLT